MRKSDGSYTYFVPDVAYHLAKFERGFTQGDQHPGHRPPRHDRARARRPAGGRRAAFRRAIRTTCCNTMVRGRCAAARRSRSPSAPAAT